MSNTFATPQKTCRYNANTFRFISHEKIEIGMTLPYGQTDKGQVLSAPVKEIIEQRPSMGTFNGERPTSYKVVLSL